VQYLGDSIFAMWNAPARDEHHVAKALRCGLAMKAAIDRMNAVNARCGRSVLATRFGIHTGTAVVGSVGANARRQYTAMGDTVNVGSRLEGMNKEFGTSILVSGAVHAAASALFVFRPLGAARAKGRAEEIAVFELVESVSS
jgi:adenylate cyclase